MKMRSLVLLGLLVAAVGCTRDPGVNAPPDAPVTEAKISKMSPEQRAAYEQAMKSRDQALAATRGRGHVASNSNGQ